MRIWRLITESCRYTRRVVISVAVVAVVVVAVAVVVVISNSGVVFGI